MWESDVKGAGRQRMALSSGGAVSELYADRSLWIWGKKRSVTQIWLTSILVQLISSSVNHLQGEGWDFGGTPCSVVSQGTSVTLALRGGVVLFQNRKG